MRLSKTKEHVSKTYVCYVHDRIKGYLTEEQKIAVKVLKAQAESEREINMRLFKVIYIKVQLMGGGVLLL